MIKDKILYAGTFDPVTNGHLDVIYRAANLCDTLVVGVLDNLQKNPRYNVFQRVEMLKLAMEGIENTKVISYSGLLADYVNDNDFCAVVRGLRAAMDFEYEIRIAQMNAKLFNKGVETIFLMSNPAHSFINSSIVKEVYSFGGNIEGLVPAKVYEYIKSVV